MVGPNGAGVYLAAERDERAWYANIASTTDRYAMGLVALGDKVFALGNFYNGDYSTNFVEEFSLDTLTWKTAEPMKRARSWHKVTNLPRSMLPLFGCGDGGGKG